MNYVLYLGKDLVMIQRVLTEKIRKQYFKGKAVIIYGPRQSGKTTFCRQLISDLDYEVKWFNGDEQDVREQLERSSSKHLKQILGNAKLIVIDEAQRIRNIGLNIKLIVDNFPAIQIIATGSSALDLASEVKESLTGRKFEHFLFPISFNEMVDHHGWMDEKALLEQRMIYGYYPEIVTSESHDAHPYLKELTDSYMYKDILSWKTIKKPHQLDKLLKALAFQVGSQVSSNELAQLCGLDSHTVDAYLETLEKTFIIYRLPSFHRNHRNELKKSKKIYFYDNGVRNSLINNFNSLEFRDDKGALWENFIINERRKFTHYNSMYMNTYFWRNHMQQEIDYIEDFDGILHAYELKYNPKAKYKFPNSFKDTYPDHESNIIHLDNFTQYLGYEI